MHLSVSVCATDYCLTRLLACFTILLIRYQQSPPGSVVVTAAISQINSPDQPSKTSAERFTFIYISTFTSSDCCVQTKGTVFKITVVYLFMPYWNVAFFFFPIRKKINQPSRRRRQESDFLPLLHLSRSFIRAACRVLFLFIYLFNLKHLWRYTVWREQQRALCVRKKGCGGDTFVDYVLVTSLCWGERTGS